jgi:hypothetical protein
MFVYEGIEDKTSEWTFEITDIAALTIESINTSTLPETITSFPIQIEFIDGIFGYVDITASKSGFSSITKRFSVAVVSDGIPSEPTNIYNIKTNSPVIRKDSAGTNDPGPYSSLTANGFKYSLDVKTPFGYLTYQFLDENGDVITGQDESDRSSETITVSSIPSTGIGSVKIRLYDAETDGIILDEEDVPIVFSGRSPLILSLEASIRYYTYDTSGDIYGTPSDSIIEASLQNYIDGETLYYTFFKEGVVIEPLLQSYDGTSSISYTYSPPTSASEISAETITLKIYRNTTDVTPAAVASISILFNKLSSGEDAVIGYLPTNTLLIYTKSNGNLFESLNKTLGNFKVIIGYSEAPNPEFSITGGVLDGSLYKKTSNGLQATINETSGEIKISATD